MSCSVEAENSIILLLSFCTIIIIIHDGSKQPVGLKKNEEESNDYSSAGNDIK